MRAAVLIPVKSFALAKLRLAPALDAPSRQALARAMASRVVAACAPLPVAVVCDDEDVATWARGQGATVAWVPGCGLDGAVGAGVEHLGSLGFDRVVVAHADLPMAEAISQLAAGTGVTLVPDRREDGTNVIVVAPGTGFRFAYGRASFTRHRAEAHRLRLPVRVMRGTTLSWDVDEPSDLDFPAQPAIICR